MKSRLPAPSPAHRPGAGLALLLASAWALAAPLPAAAAASPAESASPESPPPIRPLVGVLLTGTIEGNDTVVTNPDGSTAAGNLSGRYEAFAGAEFPLAPNGLTLRLTFGIHVAPMSSSSGSESFIRFPLEASVWYPLNDKLRVGGGARYAMRMRFNGAGDNTSNGLNATPGILFLADYRVLPHLSLDMRYVYERYENPAGNDVEASHWGFGATAIY